MRISEYLEIGSKLKAARKEARISQREMAKELGLSASTYSNYENGYSEPPMETILAFCQQVDKTFEQLLKIELPAKRRVSHADTFADVLSIIIDLDRRGLPITKAVHYLTKPDNQLHAELTLDFANAQLASFLPDWNRMNNQLKDGLIDEQEYQIWLEDTLSLFNVPIDSYIY